MATKLLGAMGWSAHRDKEGHREYKIKWKVLVDKGSGPQTATFAPGLPIIGSTWNFGGDNDPWAFCYPTLDIRQLNKADEPAQTYSIEQTFSTRPLNRCQTNSIEDPLLEPSKLRGSFVKYTKEAKRNWDGAAEDPGGVIEYSSHEPITGPEAEVTDNRPTVIFEKNVAALELDLITEMVDTVNDDVLWGLEKRKIKLTNVSWEEKWFGTCDNYFTRSFEFEINFDTFDKSVPDYVTKLLNGHWDEDAEVGTGCTPNLWIPDKICGEWPDATNPQHFIRAKDRHGENVRMMANGAGLPASENPKDPFQAQGTGTTPTPTTTFPADIAIEYYPESNFLLLGIPVSLGPSYGAGVT